MNAFQYEPKLARAYHKLLTALDWQDDILINGLRKGLNKFLSNAYLTSFPGIHKYHTTHLVSALALAKLQRKEYKGLVFEHLVPKKIHLQKDCEDRAKAGTLTVGYIEKQLRAYWCLATITKDEDERLERHRMPSDWDGESITARYDAAGIKLIPNPYFPDNASHL